MPWGINAVSLATADSSAQFRLPVSNCETLVKAVGTFAPLSVEEQFALRDAAHGALRIFGPKRDIVREGNQPKGVFLIENGWACRYKALADGRRQIINVLLPGDIVDLNLDLVTVMDHSISALSRVEIIELAPNRLRSAMYGHPTLLEAIYWRQMVDAATAREWICNVGRRTAIERMAHLLCELYTRLRSVGLTADGRFQLLMTQGDLADATGLTPVHTNRMMKELREAGLIEYHSRWLTLLDVNRLKSIGQFDDNYLHLGRGLPA